MFKSKRRFIVITLCVLLVISIGSVYASILSSNANKERYNQLKTEFQQKKEELLRTSGGKKTHEEVEKRYQEGLELKKKSLELTELAREVDPPTVEKEFQKKLNAYQLFLDMLPKTNPEFKDKAVQEQEKLNQIKNDHKNNTKTVEELLKELDGLSKTKLNENLNYVPPKP